MGLLIGLTGGCWSKKAQEQAVAPAKETEKPVDTSEQDPEPLFVQGQPVIEVVMKVEQEVITTSDVLTALAQPLTELGKQVQGDQFRAQTEQMILQYLRARSVDILLINEAETSLDENQKTMVQRQIEIYSNLLLQQCDNSQTQLENKLREEGTTLEETLKDYRRALVVERYLMEQFRSRINITKQDIIRYYKQHHDRYSSPKKVELLKILIITAKHTESGDKPAESQERAHQIARKAWDELYDDVAFGEVARKYSDIRRERGGNWGLVNPASLKDPEMRETIAKLKAGMYSSIFQTPQGFCIIGVAKIIPAQQTPLEDVQAQIKQALWEKHYTRLRNKRLTELKKKAVTTFSRSAVELALDLAQRRFERKN